MLRVSWNLPPCCRESLYQDPFVTTVSVSCIEGFQVMKCTLWQPSWRSLVVGYTGWWISDCIFWTYSLLCWICPKMNCYLSGLFNVLYLFDDFSLILLVLHSSFAASTIWGLPFKFKQHLFCFKMPSNAAFFLLGFTALSYNQKHDLLFEEQLFSS